MRAELTVIRVAVRVAVWVAVFVASLADLSSAVAQTGAAAVEDEVAVVVNNKNPVSNLTTLELRQLFAGQKRSWMGGRPVVLFVRAPGAHERVVLLKLLDMSESDYKRYWTVQVFRGEAMAEPVALFSNGMQKEALTTFPGAIALVNYQDVKPGMKILKVDGHLPGEAAYPLN